MYVFRRTSIEVTDKYMVGDQTVIHLEGMGDFFVTAQRVYPNGNTLFFFDDCVCRKPMNTEKACKNFFKTTLGKWLNTELIEKFPEEIRAQMVDVDEGRALRLPYYGELFGQDEYSKYFLPDERKQLPLMETRRNRVCSAPDSEYCWYWCMNARKDSAANFCNCDYDGVAGTGNASGSYGVRPAFILKSPAPRARD